MCEYKVMVGVELIYELLRKSGGEYPESRIPSVVAYINTMKTTFDFNLIYIKFLNSMYRNMEPKRSRL